MNQYSMPYSPYSNYYGYQQYYPYNQYSAYSTPPYGTYGTGVYGTPMTMYNSPMAYGNSSYYYPAYRQRGYI